MMSEPIPVCRPGSGAVVGKGLLLGLPLGNIGGPPIDEAENLVVMKFGFAHHRTRSVREGPWSGFVG